MRGKGRTRREKGGGGTQEENDSKGRCDLVLRALDEQARNFSHV